MRSKQNLTGQQRISIISVSLSSSKSLEEQVREHPVVLEVMRLFDARIVAITRNRVSERG